MPSPNNHKYFYSCVVSKCGLNLKPIILGNEITLTKRTPRVPEKKYPDGSEKKYRIEVASETNYTT